MNAGKYSFALYNEATHHATVANGLELGLYVSALHLRVGTPLQEATAVCTGQFLDRVLTRRLVAPVS